MGQQSQHASPPRHDAAAFMRGAARGAIAGAALGTLLIGVGVLRAGALLLAGHSMHSLSAQEMRSLTGYVASFAIGGAIVGALRALPFAGLRYVAYVAGGIVALWGVMLAMNPGVHHDTTDWVLYGCVGVVVGLALTAKQPS